MIQIAEYMASILTCEGYADKWGPLFKDTDPG